MRDSGTAGIWPSHEVLSNLVPTEAPYLCKALSPRTVSAPLATGKPSQKKHIKHAMVFLHLEDGLSPMTLKNQECIREAAIFCQKSVTLKESKGRSKTQIMSTESGSENETQVYSGVNVKVRMPDYIPFEVC